MKNLNDYNLAAVADETAWRQQKKALKDACRKLEEIYTARWDRQSPYFNVTPQETCEALIAEVGYDMAVSVIATLVNRFAWDGRISHWNASWAKNQEDSWDEAAALQIGLSAPSIHIAHLDQIASAIRQL